ncbi:MAG: 3-methylornithine--L-lysine ligase PylC [Deltaproteobacteria bacterium]|jgi:pyrrolysine biosynthesis protein PylC|nr:3-methylornithine--L-lysine ligase PylC [Deltaproteobacteria bacterium]
MKVLCLGAGLQGLEVAYLGLKAGWDVTLVDRRKTAPACGLAHAVVTDLSRLDAFGLSGLCFGYDLIVPAIEDLAILERLSEARAKKLIPPLAFDLEAYRLSSSKILSKKLFKRLLYYTPRDFNRQIIPDLPKDPAHEIAFVAKPSGLSGSKGVKVFNDYRELLREFPEPEDAKDMVFEEFIEGPMYSVEVTAVNGMAKSHQVTLLGMDAQSDCNKVTAPSGLSRFREAKFRKIAANLAKEMNLTGIMDLEAILMDDKFYLLEIDARFPSQTPITVYWSTGINLLVELAACFVKIPPKTPRLKKPAQNKSVTFEQFMVVRGKPRPYGERLFTTLGPVTLVPGFMGSNEALVAGNPKSSHFGVTLIRAH